MNFKSFISKINCWNDFKNVLETKTKLEKGKAFEKLTQYYLEYNPVYNVSSVAGRQFQFIQQLTYLPIRVVGDAQSHCPHTTPNQRRASFLEHLQGRSWLCVLMAASFGGGFIAAFECLCNS